MVYLVHGEIAFPLPLHLVQSCSPHLAQLITQVRPLLNRSTSCTLSPAYNYTEKEPSPFLSTWCSPHLAQLITQVQLVPLQNRSTSCAHLAQLVREIKPYWGIAVPLPLHLAQSCSSQLAQLMTQVQLVPLQNRSTSCTFSTAYNHTEKEPSPFLSTWRNPAHPIWPSWWPSYNWSHSKTDQLVVHLALFIREIKPYWGIAVPLSLHLVQSCSPHLAQLGCAGFAFKKFRFEAKWSETSSVSHVFRLFPPKKKFACFTLFRFDCFASTQSEAKHMIIFRSFAL